MPDPHLRYDVSLAPRDDRINRKRYSRSNIFACSLEDRKIALGCLYPSHRSALCCSSSWNSRAQFEVALRKVGRNSDQLIYRVHQRARPIRRGDGAPPVGPRERRSWTSREPARGARRLQHGDRQPSRDRGAASRLPSLRAMHRKPSCLILVQPMARRKAGAGADVRHGAMKPTGTNIARR